MSEFRVTLSPALAGRAAVSRKGISVEAQPEGTLLHLLVHPTMGDAVRLAADLMAVGLELRPLTTGQWFAVGDTALAHADLAALSATLKPQADIVDQSHGRVRIIVKGKMAARVLSKGTAVDLDIAVFPVGHATTTLFGHISAHVTRIGEDVFELIVLRGFAESLWDELAQMSLEFS